MNVLNAASWNSSVSKKLNEKWVINMIQNEIYEQFGLWINDLLEQNTMPEDTAAF